MSPIDILYVQEVWTHFKNDILYKIDQHLLDSIQQKLMQDFVILDARLSLVQYIKYKQYSTNN